MEAFEYSGIWWLPNNPENQVSGILKFDPVEGAKLDLIGTFGSKSINFTDFVTIIHGVTVKAAKVTLWECFGSISHTFQSGLRFDRSSYNVSIIFLDYHFKSYEEILFKRLSVNYSNLENWVDDRVFNTESDNAPTKFVVTYRNPQRRHIKIGDTTITIWQSPSLREDLQEVHLKQRSVITVSVKQPMHFDRLMSEVLHHVRNFISFGLGQGIYPLMIEGRIPGSKQWVTVFFVVNRPPKLPTANHPRYMLFSLQDISKDFRTYFKNWFAKLDTLMPVYDLYFEVLYSPILQVEVGFLLLAQALEAYHSRVYGGRYMLPKEYKTVREKLSRAIPSELVEEHKKSLQSRIDFGNEYSLLTRLRLVLNDILMPYAAQVDALVGDREKFAKTIRDTRNNLTHHGNKGKFTLTDTKEMYIYVQKMKLILQMCFLVELEFPSEQASKLISQNMPYVNLTSRF